MRQRPRDPSFIPRPPAFLRRQRNAPRRSLFARLAQLLGIA